ncbi:MAG: DUF5700 domain-containing putative Zn-dependent protease [Saprospiraceae bacterium]
MTKRRITILIFFYFSVPIFGQKINIEPVEKYFAMTDLLRQNISISTKTWNDFIRYDGIQLYLQNQGFDSSYLEDYRKTMEIVYMPKNDSILKVRLQNNEKYFLVWEINNYKIEEENFKQYIANLKLNSNEFLNTNYKMCYEYLPKRMQKKAAKTTLYFIPLYNDAVAEGNDIIFTLYCAYHFDKLKNGVLGGHEIHHILRKNKKLLTTKDSIIYEALTLVLNEGSADLIDKKYTADKQCPIDMAFYSYLIDEGKNYIANLDSAIIDHISIKKAMTKKDFQSIVPMSGHIPGCFMATVIERNGLKDEMIKHIDDPIQFFLLYNKAAKIDIQKPYIYSDITINYLKTIKQKIYR